MSHGGGHSGFRFLTRFSDVYSDVDLTEEDRNGLFDQHDREIEDYVSQIHLYTTEMTRVVVTGGRSTTSTSYAEPTTDVCRVSFRKRYPDTLIVARVYTTCFASVAGAGPTITWGVGDGTNVADAAFLLFNNVNVHMAMAGEAHIASLSKGLYTFTLQWKVGTGTTGNLDGNDTLELSITEMLAN